MADIPPLQIRRLEASDADLYRDIRLEALKRNPEAFASTFERENAQPLSWFEAVVGRADIFGAFLDGVLVGVAGFAAPEGLKQAHKGLLWGMYVRTAARNMREIWILEKDLSRLCSTMRAGALSWFN